MNEKIRELARRVVGKHKNDVSSIGLFDEQIEQFAELIVKECAGLVQGISTDSMGYHTADQKIKEHFGVEENKGWVCPRCGVDRTKTVCPQGHMAAVEGKCPMSGVAQ